MLYGSGARCGKDQTRHVVKIHTKREVIRCGGVSSGVVCACVVGTSVVCAYVVCDSVVCAENTRIKPVENMM